MNAPSQAPKQESVEIEGHVVTAGVVFHADTRRWEPAASIQPAWPEAPLVRLTTPPEHFQDTPQDAMAVAHKMAADWVAANGKRDGGTADDGTVDAAV